MKRTMAALGLIAALPVPIASHASSASVTIVGFQYVTSGYATADPFSAAGGAGTIALPAGTPLDAPTVIRPGSISFTNMDQVPHTVTKVSGPAGTWPAITIASGSSGSITIGATFAKGTYVYRCTIHSGMRGSFIVA